MKEYFFKRALPFILTFAVGAAVGGLFRFIGARAGRDGRVWDHQRTYRGRYGCDQRFRRYAHAPERKPPVILFKPDARRPADYRPVAHDAVVPPVRVRVAFGAEGKVHAAEALDGLTPGMRESAESAAWQIRFNPATVDGVRTTVTEDVLIRVADY